MRRCVRGGSPLGPVCYGTPAVFPAPAALLLEPALVRGHCSTCRIAHCNRHQAGTTSFRVTFSQPKAWGLGPYIPPAKKALCLLPAALFSQEESPAAAEHRRAPYQQVAPALSEMPPAPAELRSGGEGVVGAGQRGHARPVGAVGGERDGGAAGWQPVWGPTAQQSTAESWMWLDKATEALTDGGELGALVPHCGRQALVTAACAAQAAQAAGALVMQFSHLGHPGPVAEARSACSRVRASGSGSQRYRALSAGLLCVETPCAWPARIAVGFPASAQQRAGVTWGVQRGVHTDSLCPRLVPGW